MRISHLTRRALAELLGTAFLVAVVVGSGIMAVRLSPHDVGLQLLENAIATGAGLVALILAFGSVSGAHFNPVVSFVDWRLGGLDGREFGVYSFAQVVGACLGCMLANVMFDLAAIDVSTKIRSGSGLFVSEIVATVGLLLVIIGTGRTHQRATPFAVGAYIAAAYFFTSSTSFANPAVTIGRTLSNTFAGIAPESVPAFVGAQVLGAVLGLGLIALLFTSVDADDVVVPHEAELS
jgi:glycerol uptake facilitator-like aquaporin